MRAICKVCTLSNVHKFGKCECPESKAYDSGYNDAVEKAAEWLKENVRNYIFRNKGREESGEGIWNYDYVFIDANLYDDFKKAMEL